MQSAPAHTEQDAGTFGPAIAATDLVFGWPKGPIILDVPQLWIARGERVFLRGPSGSGKSTLLGLIAGVTAARPGVLRVLGEDMGRLPPHARDRLRADRMGVNFQMFNLVPYVDVIGNVLLPLSFSPARAQKLRAAGVSPRIEAQRLLARLGLEDPALLRRRPGELSVGQQQRVAAARALVGSPDLVLADEPTSALDSDARAAFISLLQQECAASSATLVFVSHDLTLESQFDRMIDLSAINRASGKRRAA